MIQEFKKFLLRGNLVDLLIGFTVGAAFSTVAKSLVTDIIMPPIGLLLGSTDFSNLYWVIKSGKMLPPYRTLAIAQAEGAVTINYGLFLNNLISLIVVGLTMFMVVRFMNRLESMPIIGSKKKLPTTKKCPFCLSTIPYRAIKCPQCTTDLPQPQPEKK